MSSSSTIAMPRTQLLMGGQKSGKSRRAELLARQWLAGASGREAVLVATGQPWDAEMRERIARHQRDRAERVPGMSTLEEPRELARVLAEHSAPQRMLVIDCLTLWLTNWLMPAEDGESQPKKPKSQDWNAQIAHFLIELEAAKGPVILVGNEIGLGVIPMGAEVRAFVDALGVLNQQVAAHCETVTFMCAGLPMAVKGPQP